MNIGTKRPRSTLLSRKTILSAAVAAAALSALATPARADLIFDLTVDNVGGTGPYVQVDVHRNSTTSATITFDALTNGGNTYFLMDGGSAAINVNGAFSLGAITGTAAPAATQATYSNGGSGNEDGFGSFNQTINSSDGFASRSTEIVVNITAIAGNSWLTDASVLTGNAQGFLAAAHIGFNGGATTGFAAGNGTPVSVPEPISLALLGTGLFGLGIARRRRM